MKRGQEVGVIRTALSDDLIFAWLQAVDNASDRWLLDQWDQPDRETIALVSDQRVDAMRRTLVPLVS